jgi:pimeloyl-ACP methyl ester carboxylesterase
MIFEDSGHSPQLQENQCFIRLLRYFLKSLPSEVTV